VERVSVAFALVIATLRQIANDVSTKFIGCLSFERISFFSRVFADNRMKQQAYRVDENMPLLAVDLFARIIAVRINAAPPISAAFTLWLSMTAAVGLASRGRSIS
jgi:hypothetical protein